MVFWLPIVLPIWKEIEQMVDRTIKIAGAKRVFCRAIDLSIGISAKERNARPMLPRFGFKTHVVNEGCAKCGVHSEIPSAIACKFRLRIGIVG